MTRVWEQSTQKGSYLLLLLAIADNANDDGFAWPGMRYLAHKTRMSKRHVRRMLRVLESAGELYVNQRHTEGEKHQYIVLVGLSSDQISQNLIDRRNLTTWEPWPKGTDLSDEEITAILEYDGGRTSCPGGEDKLSGGGGQVVTGGRTHESAHEPSNNHQTTINEPALSVVGALLSDFGIQDPMLTKLVELNLDEAVVKEWIAYARARNLGPGFVINKLRAGSSPPQQQNGKQNWYTEKEYEECFVQPEEE